MLTSALGQTVQNNNGQKTNKIRFVPQTTMQIKAYELGDSIMPSDMQYDRLRQKLTDD